MAALPAGESQFPNASVPSRCANRKEISFARAARISDSRVIERRSPRQTLRISPRVTPPDFQPPAPPLAQSRQPFCQPRAFDRRAIIKAEIAVAKLVGGR